MEAPRGNGRTRSKKKEGEPKSKRRSVVMEKEKARFDVASPNLQLAALRLHIPATNTRSRSSTLPCLPFSPRCNYEKITTNPNTTQALPSKNESVRTDRSQTSSLSLPATSFSYHIGSLPRPQDQTLENPTEEQKEAQNTNHQMTSPIRQFLHSSLAQLMGIMLTVALLLSEQKLAFILSLLFLVLFNETLNKAYGHSMEQFEKANIPRSIVNSVGYSMVLLFVDKELSWLFGIGTVIGAGVLKSIPLKVGIIVWHCATTFIYLYSQTENLKASVVPTLLLAAFGYFFIILFNEMARLSAENAAIMRNTNENAVRRQKWLAALSHEIRTPLAGVTGVAALLKNSGINSEQEEYIAIIDACSHTLINLANDFLDFTKLEVGKMALEHVEFDLIACVDEVFLGLSGNAAEAGLQLISFVDRELNNLVIGDPSKIKQVLMNLIANGIKFTPKGYIKLTVSALPSSNTASDVNDPSIQHVVFEVEDSGIGISEQAMQTLFESFNQGDPSTTRKYGGTGLGLAISKNLGNVTSCCFGGSISVTSQVGVGSCFKVTIPFPLSPPPSEIPLAPLQGMALKLSLPDILKEGTPSLLLILPTPEDMKNCTEGMNDGLSETANLEMNETVDDEVKRILGDGLIWDFLRTQIENWGGKVETLSVTHTLSFLERRKSVLSPNLRRSEIGEKEEQPFVEPGWTHVWIDADNLTIPELKTSLLTGLKDQLNLYCTILISPGQMEGMMKWKEQGFIDDFLFKPLKPGAMLHNLFIKANLNLSGPHSPPSIPISSASNTATQIPTATSSQTKPSPIQALPLYSITPSTPGRLSFSETSASSNEPLKTLISPIGDSSGPPIVTTTITVTSPKSSPRKRVLVVDDNTVMRKIVTKVLERWGFHIDEGRDGQEAIKMVQQSVEKEQEYDIILMDMEMPICDGFQATKAIRQIPTKQRTPIFALTAHIFESAKKQFMEVGGDDFLTKPLKVDLLKEKLSKYM